MCVNRSELYYKTKKTKISFVLYVTGVHSSQTSHTHTHTLPHRIKIIKFIYATVEIDCLLYGNLLLYASWRAHEHSGFYSSACQNSTYFFSFCVLAAGSDDFFSFFISNLADSLPPFPTHTHTHHQHTYAFSFCLLFPMSAHIKKTVQAGCTSVHIFVEKNKPTAGRHTKVHTYTI